MRTLTLPRILTTPSLMGTVVTVTVMVMMTRSEDTGTRNTVTILSAQYPPHTDSDREHLPDTSGFVVTAQQQMSQLSALSQHRNKSAEISWWCGRAAAGRQWQWQ